VARFSVLEVGQREPRHGRASSVSVRVQNASFGFAPEEYQRQFEAIGGDPFGGQAVSMGAGDVPLAMSDRGPWAPRFGRVEQSPGAGVVVGGRHQVSILKPRCQVLPPSSDQASCALPTFRTHEYRTPSTIRMPLAFGLFAPSPPRSPSERRFTPRKLAGPPIIRAPETGLGVAERVAVPHHDQFEARHYHDHLMRCPRARECIAWRRRPDAVGVGVPGEAGCGCRIGGIARGTRHPLIGEHSSHDIAPDQLAAHSLALEHH
jgi:hypothetical protein